MNNKFLSLTFILFLILFLAGGCNTQTQSKIAATTTTQQNIIITPSCKTDAECIFKEAAYCCGNTKAFIQACFHINETPRDVDCSDITTCPGFLAISDCRCVNNKCV
jgi:hypothetical protein